MNLEAILRQGALACPAAAVDQSTVDRAVAHGVAALLYRALQQAGRWDDLDDAVRERLTQIAREAVLIEHVRAGHLATTVRALAAREVHPVLFKGAALAASHYPEPWLRTRGDSDLLVRPAEVHRAGAVLERLGFSRLSRPRGSLVTQQSRYEGTVDGVSLAYDVHWRVADPHAFVDALPYDEIERAAVGDHPSGARRFGDVHALATACVHRAAHHYDTGNLLLLYDVHLIGTAFTPTDWANFTELIIAKELRAVARRALGLAADAFGTPVPLDIQQRLSGGNEEPTARFVASRLRRIDILRSDLRALPDWPDRIDLLFGHLFPGKAYLHAVSRVRNQRLSFVRRIASGVAKWFRPLQ